MSLRRPTSVPRARLAVLLFLAAISPSLHGQASDRPCAPVAQRTDDPAPACFTAKQDLGPMPAAPVFWYLATFPTRASAEAARGPRGTVVESLGKIWLFTVAEETRHPSTGTFVAKVGPLPVDPGGHYEAVYLQSIFNPGMVAPTHIHSGPEAFYTLTGSTCLETPEGKQVGTGPGHVILIRRGPPMLLMATGTEKRRGVVLILHDVSEPATTMVHDWTPKGLCHL